MEHTYKRIIITRTDKIGDLLLSIPSFFMLKKMYPEAEIILLVRSYNYSIVKDLPYIDRVIKIDDFRKKELIEKVKYFNTDVFVALYVDSYILELAKASGAKIKIGPYSKLKSFFTFNKGVYQKRSKSIKNEADYNLDLIKKLDQKLFEEKFEINTDIIIPSSSKKAVVRFLAENDIQGKMLVINPFMGGSAKNITDKQYVELIKEIKKEKKDLNIIITCHISDEERGLNLINEIDEEKVYLFANGGDLLNLGALIERSDLYFGGSTGPTHMAGALKKDIVALYPNKPSQSPKRWGVYNSLNTVYVVPDKDPKIKENYKHKDFDSYTEGTQKEIVKLIIEGLNK